jgi:hypothetical protein
MLLKKDLNIKYWPLFSIPISWNIRNKVLKDVLIVSHLLDGMSSEFRFSYVKKWPHDGSGVWRDCWYDPACHLNRVHDDHLALLSHWAAGQLATIPEPEPHQLPALNLNVQAFEQIGTGNKIWKSLETFENLKNLSVISHRYR